MRELVRNVRTLYDIRRASTLFVYMLQSVEYRAVPYLAWLWYAQDFSRIIHRRVLDPTRAARLLRIGAAGGMFAQLGIGLLVIAMGVIGHVAGAAWFGLALVLSYPIVWAHVLALVVAVGQVVVVAPRQKSQAATARAIFSAHSGKRIAIAGSYGKTSMKELLVTILSEGKNVAATPANMNVLSSHVKFAQGLTGKEDILLIEFGEGEPGDVERFSDVVQPTHAVITGLAPAHLDRYKTLAAAGADIFSVATHMPPDRVYVNAESTETAAYIREGYETYDQKGALGWTVTNPHTGLEGTSFTLVKGSKRMALKSQLVGLHHVGPLALGAALALALGLTDEQVIAGIAKTKPFEHRMQPYRLHGAWIIDDTYNGNLDGIRAGTALLAGLTASRKIYVTPGLVDQGGETARIHRTVGELIASAEPDLVVLMRNSVTDFIKTGLRKAGYKGDVLIQNDPLDFYRHLADFVAAGDVVLLQNDWTDNYR